MTKFADLDLEERIAEKLYAFLGGRPCGLARIAPVGLDLPKGSHWELSLHQFKSQLPSDELGGTL